MRTFCISKPFDCYEWLTWEGQKTSPSNSLSTVISKGVVLHHMVIMSRVLPCHAQIGNKHLRTSINSHNISNEIARIALLMRSMKTYSQSNLAKLVMCITCTCWSRFQFMHAKIETFESWWKHTVPDSDYNKQNDQSEALAKILFFIHCFGAVAFFLRN